MSLSAPDAVVVVLAPVPAVLWLDRVGPAVTGQPLRLVIERPNRGPRTHRVGIDLTLDEMRRIAEGDNALSG